MSVATAFRVGVQRPRLWNLPADIDNTDAGDEVIEFARRFGLELDDWQQWCVRHMCAERVDGSWAATQSILLVPRQCGKSALLEAIELAALFLWDEQHIIYSAHLGKTATDHMRRIRAHINHVPDFKRQARVLTARGDERVERLDTGAILEFITRGKKTSRGGSPNRVIFDEAMFLKDEQIQAMVPALSAQSMNEDAGASMIYTSSAPIAESQVLHRLRKRSLTESPRRVFFAEWSVPEDSDPSDRDNWYLANPGLGIRISEEWVEDNEFGTLSPEAFAVERLGIAEELDEDTQVIPADVWASLVDAGSEIVSHRCYALDVSPDRRWASFAAAGRRADGRLHIEAPEHRPRTEWVKAYAVELFGKHRVGLRIDKSGPAASFIAPLREAGVEVVEVSGAEVSQACGQFIDAALNDGLRHLNGLSLNSALKGAVLRSSGDAALWGRRASKVDISALCAVTVALGGVPATAAAFAY